MKQKIGTINLRKGCLEFQEIETNYVLVRYLRKKHQFIEFLRRLHIIMGRKNNAK